MRLDSLLYWPAWAVAATLLTWWLARRQRRRGGVWSRSGVVLAAGFALVATPVLAPLAGAFASGPLIVAFITESATGANSWTDLTDPLLWIAPGMLATFVVVLIVLWFYFRRAR